MAHQIPDQDYIEMSNGTKWIKILYNKLWEYITKAELDPEDLDQITDLEWHSIVKTGTTITMYGESTEYESIPVEPPYYIAVQYVANQLKLVE